LKIHEEVDKDTKYVLENVKLEKKEREDTDENILELLKDMVNGVKSEMENEKKDRKSSEETMLLLLE
jgi:hypothetical protein